MGEVLGFLPKGQWEIEATKWINEKYLEKQYRQTDDKKEVWISLLSRPDDIHIVRIAARLRFMDAVCRLKDAYLLTSWRIPLEEDDIDTGIMTKIDPEGPDKDFFTDTRGIMDKNWKSVKIYARFYVEKKS